MMSRVLPVTEWARLDATSLAPFWRAQLDPRFCEVLVVEDGGEIVAQLVLVQMVHAECCENRGGTGAMRLLWTAMQDRVRATGASAVWAAAVDAPMSDLLENHAERLPGDHYLLRMPCHH